MQFLKHLWPKSLYSQILAAAAVALLIAQIINGVFLLNGLRARGVNEAANILMNSAAVRLQTRGFEEIGQNDISQNDISQNDISQNDNSEERRAQRRQRREERRNRNTIRIRNLDYIRLKEPVKIIGYSQNKQLSDQASSIMALDTKIGIVPIAYMPSQLKGRIFERQRLRYRRNSDISPPDEAMILSFQDNGLWIYAVRPIRPLDKSAVWALIIQTLFLYIILLSVLAIVARRISRPLDRLKEAMAHFGPNNLGHELKTKGPHDVRELIDNYNDMRNRISALLSEKDVMLGAIGHDLKTPLASLRVRVESVEDDDERAKMIASIDDMNVMLSDILMLARLGKSNEAMQKIDVNTLIEAVIDDFSEQGDAIQFTPFAPIVAMVKPSLLRRALRNIISNALRYGGDADIETRIDGAQYIIIIKDNGPGIDPQKMEAVFEPFERLERSRNKESGGSGLGLTIARAITEAHGGKITLQNQSGGGLQVTMTLSL